MVHSYRPLTSTIKTYLKFHMSGSSITRLKRRYLGRWIHGLHKLLCGADRSASELERLIGTPKRRTSTPPNGMRAGEARDGLGGTVEAAAEICERVLSSRCAPPNRFSYPRRVK
jgi:hypothetical protein